MNMQLPFQNKVNMVLNLSSPGAKGESIKRTILNQETGMLSVEYMNGTIEDLTKYVHIKLTESAVKRIFG